MYFLCFAKRISFFYTYRDIAYTYRDLKIRYVCVCGVLSACIRDIETLSSCLFVCSIYFEKITTEK